MVDLDACDLAHDLIRQGVDDGDVVAGGVGLNDADLAGRRRGAAHGLPAHPCRQSLPLWVLLRFPVLAPVVSVVSARLLFEWMPQ